MVFDSIEDCIEYIESCIEASMITVSFEIKNIMDEVTRQQVRGWSNQIFSSVIADSEDMTAFATFEDRGSWYSLITGESVGNPIKFLEAGSTWNRGATNIMDIALGRAESEIPQLFVQLLRRFGIPIQ